MSHVVGRNLNEHGHINIVCFTKLELDIFIFELKLNPSQMIHATLDMTGSTLLGTLRQKKKFTL